MLQDGIKIEFIAKDIEGKDVKLSDFSGKKVISTIPKLNTGICDMQTGTMKGWAGKYKDVSFITLSRDAVEIAKEWCGAHDNVNAHVLSDLDHGEMGDKYELVDHGMLKRGFIILDEKNEIIGYKIEDKTKNEPDYDLVEDFLATL